MYSENCVGIMKALRFYSPYIYSYGILQKIEEHVLKK